MAQHSNVTDTADAFRLALWLEGLTLVWMVVEAGVSLGAGIVAGSLLLVIFGADSIIELLSACMLMWQLRREAWSGPDEATAAEELRRRVTRLSGYLLFALSLYVVAQAVYGLVHRNEAERSLVGIGVAVVAGVGMPFLARAKIRVADCIGSRALRADAMETLTCGYLAWALLAGLAANALLHWWWLDAVASLAIVPLLVREAREALSGAECCDHCHCE
jgi:hypothetical protein